jgi:hypothetical protein
MSERTYKQAFVISAVICLVLAGTLAYVIWVAVALRLQAMMRAL